jgi:hypothetical protein
MKTMTDITLDIQKRVGRPATLQLLARAGEASRVSEGQFAPVAVLALMQHRLGQGWTAEKIAAIKPGKLIQLTRKFVQKQASTNGGS